MKSSSKQRQKAAFFSEDRAFASKRLAFVDEGEFSVGVQEGQFPQTTLDFFDVPLDWTEDLLVWREPHPRASRRRGVFLCTAWPRFPQKRLILIVLLLVCEGLDYFPSASFEALNAVSSKHLSTARKARLWKETTPSETGRRLLLDVQKYRHFHASAECVHDCQPNAVEASAAFVRSKLARRRPAFTRASPELAACVQPRDDGLDGSARPSGKGAFVDKVAGNAAPVVRDARRADRQKPQQHR